MRRAAETWCPPRKLLLLFACFFCLFSRPPGSFSRRRQHGSQSRRRLRRGEHAGHSRRMKKACCGEAMILAKWLSRLSSVRGAAVIRWREEGEGEGGTMLTAASNDAGGCIGREVRRRSVLSSFVRLLFNYVGRLRGRSSRVSSRKAIPRRV